MSLEPTRLSAEDLAAEHGTPLPAKEVLSLLDLNVDLDLGLDLAAPIDLAVAANANIAAPVDAAASANILSTLSTAAAAATQDVVVDQRIAGEAIADAPQTAALDQGDDVLEPAPTEPVPTESTTSSFTDGNLLNVDVDLALDADIAAPIAGAVAANANVAAPIDAAVSANIGSVGSEAVAVADQSAVLTQDLDGVVADATADQDATITQ